MEIPKKRKSPELTKPARKPRKKSRSADASPDAPDIKQVGDKFVVVFDTDEEDKAGK